MRKSAIPSVLPHALRRAVTLGFVFVDISAPPRVCFALMLMLYSVAQLRHAAAREEALFRRFHERLLLLMR